MPMRAESSWTQFGAFILVCVLFCSIRAMLTEKANKVNLGTRLIGKSLLVS